MNKLLDFMVKLACALAVLAMIGFVFVSVALLTVSIFYKGV